MIEVEDVFKPQYAQLIRDFESEKKGLFAVNSSMISLLNSQEGAVKPKLMLKESVRNQILTDENHPLNQALRRMDVYDWIPESPLLMIYCTNDDQVTYRNAVSTDSLMNAKGANDVSSIDIFSAGTHSSCVLPASLKMKDYFSQFQEIGSVGTTTTEISQLHISPNPASQQFSLIMPDQIKGSAQLIMRNIHGQIIKQWRLNNHHQQWIDIEDISEHMLFIEILQKGQVIARDKLIIF